MARPYEYDKDLALEICERVREGEHVHEVLKSDIRFPSLQTWYNWLQKERELIEFYHACRRDKAEAKEAELLDVLKDVKSGKIDPHSGKVVIDALKWLTGIYNARLFSTKQEVSIGEDVQGITINIATNKGD